MGRAPRRGSLATTSGRPARVWRPCAGGTVADVTMSHRVRGPGRDLVRQRYRDFVLQLQGLAILSCLRCEKRAGGREGGRARLGRGLSFLDLSPRPSTTAGIRCPGPLHLLLGFDTARGRVRAVVGGESQPGWFTRRRISPGGRDVGLQSMGSRPRHLQGFCFPPLWEGRSASPGVESRAYRVGAAQAASSRPYRAAHARASSLEWASSFSRMFCT